MSTKKWTLAKHYYLNLFIDLNENYRIKRKKKQPEKCYAFFTQNKIVVYSFNMNEWIWKIKNTSLWITKTIKNI